MYIEDKVKPSYDKFISYLENHINEKQKELEEYELKKGYKEIIDNLIKNPNLEDVLAHRDFLMSLNNSLDTYFKLIDFFLSRNASNAPQVSIAIRSIIECDDVKNYEINISSNFNPRVIKEEIEQYKSLLNGINYDIDFLVSILDKSPLTENEKLDVLSKNAFDRIMQKKIKDSVLDEKNNALEESMNQTINEPEIEDMVDISKLKSRYMISYSAVDNIKRMYNYLTKNKTDKQIMYAKSMYKLYDLNEFTQEDINNYLPEIMTSLFLGICENDDEINKLLSKERHEKILRSDAEILTLYLEELEGYIIQFSNLSVLTKEKNDEEIIDKRRNLYLTDESGKCLIEFDGYNKQEMATLLEKISKKLKRKDYKTQTDRIVSMSNVSKLACIYITINNKYNLVIGFSHIEDAHYNANTISNRYESLINYFTNLNDNELDELYNNQGSIRNGTENKQNITLEGDAIKL